MRCSKKPPRKSNPELNDEFLRRDIAREIEAAFAHVHYPPMTLESGLALARALVVACPQNAPARIRKAAQKLGNAADKAQDKLALRQKTLGTVSMKNGYLVSKRQS